jgi:hypothetical protein
MKPRRSGRFWAFQRLYPLSWICGSITIHRILFLRFLELLEEFDGAVIRKSLGPSVVADNAES